MIEIGVARGNSIFMWKDLFPRLTYFGLDLGLEDLTRDSL